MNGTPHDHSYSVRGQFSTRLGFVLAAAGSAVGLGNIWGFPTQTVENGGGAFVLVYLVCSLILAYPVLVAELVIGRHAQSDAITAMERVPTDRKWRGLTRFSGLMATLTVCLILAFYSIVGGWLTGFALSPLLHYSGLSELSSWLVTFSTSRNLVLTAVFLLVTCVLVCRGVRDGIERWSARLMPLLLVLLLVMIAIILGQPGGLTGLYHYLVPDLQHINPSLILSATGQSFFSMSLGVGAMMTYGSYLNRKANLPLVALQVSLLDTGIALLAGMLIVPALYVALSMGLPALLENGHLVDSDRLVFELMPLLFGQFGAWGELISLLFFSLLCIAALTSSISMLEVPVASLTERCKWSRLQAGAVVSCAVLSVSILVIFFFDPVFGALVTLTTQYALPVHSLLLCLYVGWLMGRHRKLEEIRRGWKDVDRSLFWRIWPWYVRIVCPLMIAIIIIDTF